MRKQIALLFALAGLAVTVAACAGYPEDQAVARCKIEQQNQAACFNSDTYDQCVACFEECGDGCAVAESCPVQYVCSKN